MSTSPPAEQPVLQALSLSRHFAPRGGFFGRQGGRVVAVDDVTLFIQTGASLGIVGESGCGKTTLGRLLVGLIEPSAGQVLFEGESLGAMTPDALRRCRRRLQVVFQDPMASLNPRMRVGKAVVEPLVVHGLLAGSNGWRGAAQKAFGRVGLDAALIDRFPHELSGGQRQRVCIARALVLDPAVLVADEPVASLDISIQTQILSLFFELFRKRERALVMISHDVRVVKALCEHVVVMYLGRIVEQAPTENLFASPLHPYTRLLIDSVCALHPNRRHVVGSPVLPQGRPETGCAFAPRCPRVQDRCHREAPPEQPLPNDRRIRCHFPLEKPRPKRS